MKWRLLLKVLPLTAIFCMAKVILYFLNWEPWAFDSLTGSLFGAATFVVAFLLSGTLSDYNASKDMVVQLANAVETIQDANLLCAADLSNYDPNPLARALIEGMETIVGCLQENKPFTATDQAFSQVNLHFLELQRMAGDSVVNRVQSELAKMRILVTRIHLIRSTDFLGPAYALLEIFLVGAVLSLLLIGADRFSENLVVACFLFTSFTYLMLLIKDLDNPFQYDGKSVVEVDLSLLTATCDRIQNSLPSNILVEL
jgi:hypothetical protein